MLLTYKLKYVGVGQPFNSDRSIDIKPWHFYTAMKKTKYTDLFKIFFFIFLDHHQHNLTYLTGVPSIVFQIYYYWFNSRPQSDFRIL